MSRTWGIQILISAVIILTACQSTTEKPKLATLTSSKLAAGAHNRGNDRYLNQLYEAAILDSAVYREDRNYSSLWPVTQQSDMVSFISCYQCDVCTTCRAKKCPSGDCAPDECTACSTCSSKCLTPGVYTANTDVWLSHAHQVKSYCQDFPEATKILNIQQLQGLPPNLDQPVNSWKFLLVNIKGPEQLFRPCANINPETTGPCVAEIPPDTPEDRQAWLANQALSAWQLPHGYPWTRQGYTYNWNPKVTSGIRLGTSEYVVPQGTRIQVTGLVNATEFCQKP